MNEAYLPSIEFISIIDKDLPQPEELSYSTSLSSGIDLRAYLPDHNITLYPGNTVVIPTGYKCQMLSLFEGQIRSRSGLAAKHNIIVLNSPGTIDADYDQEIKIVLHKMLTEKPDEPFTIKHGDRIAQFVLSQVIRAHKYLPKTFIERNGGFNSTGV
jgi:dUTP pyrophosphatase